MVRITPSSRRVKENRLCGRRFLLRRMKAFTELSNSFSIAMHTRIRKLTIPVIFDGTLADMEAPAHKKSNKIKLGMPLIMVVERYGIRTLSMP